MLKWIYLIIGLLFISFTEAQNLDHLPKAEREYFELLNYTPVNYIANTPTQTLNSIWKLKSAYEKKSQLEKEELIWIEKAINQIALAFFLENKPILLLSENGLEGDPNKLINKTIKNNRTITTLDLRHGGCISFSSTDDFIRIFNNRTKKLIASN
ncbi:hypothetical protein SCB49_08668 [unidentified eubacterium SCB49]|nr:hypothetical protein SCB49_08668 [unidentified eubacterium SCB49]